MTDHILQLLQFIAQVGLTGGIAGAIAYWIFRTYSSKWLDNKFAKGLSDYKHAQAKEMEDVRFKIQATFDRLTKLHQKEFEILPEAWARLYDAYWKAEAFFRAAKSYPDLNKMTDAHLDEFLESCPLFQYQKDEARQAQNKTEAYIKFIEWHSLADAKETSVESHSYLQKNGIFLKQEMREKFGAIDDLIWKALKAKELILRHGHSQRRMDTVTDFEKQSEALMKKLEEIVRYRLHE